MGDVRSRKEVEIEKCLSNYSGHYEQSECAVGSEVRASGPHHQPSPDCSHRRFGYTKGESCCYHQQALKYNRMYKTNVRVRQS